jgi:hypothetical protein
VVVTVTASSAVIRRSLPIVLEVNYGFIPASP